MEGRCLSSTRTTAFRFPSADSFDFGSVLAYAQITIQEGPFRGHQLVEPDQAELARAMRLVVQNPEKLSEIRKEARESMVREYSEEAMGKVLEAEFLRIENVILGRELKKEL